MALFILIISVVDGLIIGAAISAMGHPARGVPIGITVMVLPWVVLAAAGPAIWSMMGLNRVQSRFPLRDPTVFTPNTKVISMAARQRWLGINNCIEAVADDDHLHIRLALPGPAKRCGVSVPWEAVTSINAETRIARIDILDVPPLWVPAQLVQRELEVRATPLPEEPIPAA